MKPRDLLDRCARGDVRNVRFADLEQLIEVLGFRLKRIGGSHHFYVHPDIDAVLNIQPLGRQATPYQARQVAELAARYSLTVENDQ